MHPGTLRRREMSSVGRVVHQTESKVAPMYIDLILPLRGETMSVDELRSLFQHRFLGKNPRFMCRVQGTAFVPTDIELERHIIEIDVPDPQTDEVLMELVSRITNEALDPARPLWAAYLINQGENQMIFLRMHHCMGDGVSLAVATMNMSDANQTEAPPDQKSRKTTCNPVTHCVNLFLMIRVLVWILVGLPLVIWKWISVLAFTPHPPPLFDRLGGRVVTGKHVAWNVKPIYVHEVKYIAKGMGPSVTFNDVLLCAISGALDRYTLYAEKEVQRTGLLVSVPVNIRRTMPEEMGNKIGGYVLNVPMGITDLEERFKEVSKRTTATKQLPEQYASYWMCVILAKVPNFIERPIFQKMTRQVNCMISNVRGTDSPYVYYGREVRRMIGFIPPPEGVPMGLAINTMGGIVNITVKADRALIRDPAKFIQFLHDEFETMRNHVLAKHEHQAGN